MPNNPFKDGTTQVLVEFPISDEERIRRLKIEVGV